MSAITTKGRVSAAPATYDELLERFQQVVAVLYAFDGTDPRRLLAEDANNPNLLVALREAARQASINLVSADVSAANSLFVRALLSATLSGALGDALANTLPQIRTLAGVLETLRLASYAHVFNGTDWDRQRGNVNRNLLASAARTADGASANQTDVNHRGLYIHTDITAISGTSPTLTENIVTYGTIVSSVNLVRGPARSVTGARLLVIHPGLSGALGAGVLGATVDGAGIPLPRNWRYEYSIGGTNPSVTFLTDVHETV